MPFGGRDRREKGTACPPPRSRTSSSSGATTSGSRNLSCYSDGLMGYRTPNIDRIADEGMRFTDSYGEQSCTAGRASFITGQSVFRTGLSKVGMPGRRRRAAGRGPDDRRAAEAARLRDRAVRQEPPRRPERVPADGARLRRVLRQPLPPERRGGARAARTTRRPTDFPHFRERFGPRGVLHSWATDEDDATEEPRWGRVGKQRIEDTGPLTKKRMETIDDEIARRRDRLHRPPARGRTRRSSSGSTRPTCTSARTPKPESLGQAGRWQSPYHDTMIDHDKHRRHAARQARRARASPRTRSSSTRTDNGPHMNTWPDGGDDAVPQREEHELGGRLPRARADPLAGQDPRRRRLERDRPAPRLAADVPGGRRRAGHRREAARRATRPATRRSRCTSTATTCCRT